MSVVYYECNVFSNSDAVFSDSRYSHLVLDAYVATLRKGGRERENE